MASMAATTTQAGSMRSPLRVAAVLACLIAVLITTTALAATAREIGKTRGTPNPSCPTPSGDAPERRQCEVLGRVTAFQKRADGKKGLMRVPADGHIVGWAVDLSHPDKEERAFFEAELSGDPSARLAMLTKADGRKYRLRAQSPNVGLKGLYGDRQYFTLNNPLEVREGWIAALTTRSWVPNFAHALRAPQKDNVWKASRTRRRCSGRGNLLNRSRPHQDVGSTRSYACTYTDARILYWAYFVPA